MNGVHCKQLSKTFSGGIRAVDEISLSLDTNRVHVILGPNGAGKSRDCVSGVDEIRRSIEVMPQQAQLYTAHDLDHSNGRDLVVSSATEQQRY